MTDPTRLSDAFEVCMAAMSTGVDLETCLKLYPDLAAELRPILITTQALHKHAAISVPAPGMKRSRVKMLARAEELNTARRPFFLRAAPRMAMAMLALILVLVLSLNGLAVASAKSLPGDALYPVKLAAENVSLELARDAEARLKMEESYQQRRAEEVRTLLSEKRISQVSFEGLIDEASPQGVVVQGIPVVFGAGTIVKGELSPGRLVEVEGTTQTDGRVDAHELHLRVYEYIGQLKDIQTGTWTIGDTRFKLLRETHLDPTLRVGEQVLVLVYSADDGSLYAQAILRVPETLVEEKSSFTPFEIEFTGTLQSVSGDNLVIAGKTVHLTDQTAVKGDFTIGTLLDVHAIVSEDGSLTAREIQVTGAPDKSGSSGEAQPSEDHSGNTGGSDDQSGETGTGDDHSGEDGSSEEDSGENKSGDEDQSDGEDQSNDQNKPGEEDQSGDEHEDGGSGEDQSSSGSDQVTEDDQSGSSGEEDHSGEDPGGNDSGDISENNSESETGYDEGEVSDPVPGGEDNPESSSWVD